MDTFILNVDLLPTKIKEKFNVKQVFVQVQKDNSGVLLLPVNPNFHSSEKAEIKNMRGSARDSKLTVEKFMELKKSDREFDKNGR
jgi:hypothetical protein